MRNIVFRVAAVGVLSACAADMSAPLDLSGISHSRCIAGTTAAAVPGYYTNRAAIRAFDGSGIAPDGTCGVAADDAMFMFSNSQSAFPWYIQVDLGETRRIDGVRLYNFNFTKNGTAYTERGVREFMLYVSCGDAWETSASAIMSNYTAVLSNRLARATGASDYAGEYFGLERPVAARFVALVALDDWDDAKATLNYNGISEILLFPSHDGPRFSICCVGDSITEGANSASAANKWTYRTYLAEVLAKAGFGNVDWKGSHVSPHSGNGLPNEGWSGQNAEQVASKYIANAEDDRADVLMLHAGHNYDATQQSESAIIAAATNAHARIIAAARGQKPNVTVLYAKVITSEKLPKYSYIPALNNAIGELAAELTTASSPVIAVDLADGWNPAKHCIGDKVHPSASGARLMAERWFAALAASPFMSGTDALVEAESFATKGGWVVDPQFVDVMGSPYLLAHGMGEPVADAETSVAFGFPDSSARGFGRATGRRTGRARSRAVPALPWEARSFRASLASRRPTGTGLTRAWCALRLVRKLSRSKTSPDSRDAATSSGSRPSPRRIRRPTTRAHLRRGARRSAANPPRRTMS